MKSGTHHTVIADLREVISALDRRVPRLDRDGEHDIARDAAELKAVALRRIAELMHLHSGAHPSGHECGTNPRRCLA